MSDQTQTYATHRRWLPGFHFVALPIILANVFVEGWRMYKYGVYKGTTWNLVFSIGVLFAVVFSRTMALKVQDRLIRLEMTLRLATMLPDSLKSRIRELTPGQLIGLRFASDSEMPALVEQCLKGDWKGAEDVKKQIKTWVPDFLRA